MAHDQSDFLENLIAPLDQNAIHFCVIDTQGVNAYVEPLVSLDLDLVVAVEDAARAEQLLSERFHIERFPHSLNVTAPGSQLRVQIQTDPRYVPFPERASVRDVLGLKLPVASIEDVLDGKIWAALDPERRASKRRKDLLDIERLIENRLDLRRRVPAEILSRAVSEMTRTVYERAP